MPRRSAGLDATQLEALATKVQAGGRPRVRVTGPQFPPDTVGTIVRIGDPQVDGDDYVTVRTKVGGVVDELAFAPAELTLATRGAAPPAEPQRATTTRRRKTIPKVTAERAAPEPAPVPPTPPAAATKPTPPARATPTRKALTARRAAASVPIKINIVSVGASWTVSIDRGARALVKKSEVTPGAVRAIADLLGEPALTAAVADVNDAARSEAEARAEKLRAELAEVQAVLDSHQSP